MSVRNRIVAALFVTALLSAPAHAVTTRTFRVTSYKDFDAGESTGVLLSSLGEAQSGRGATRIAIPESVVYSSAVTPSGTVFLGTGDQGNIYTYSGGDQVKRLARIDAVLVTALEPGPSGLVFAAGMPGGSVFAVDSKGHVRTVAKLDAEHVWALSYDAGKHTLYAATGPRGRLYAIDVSHLGHPRPSSRVRLVYDTGEKHLLSMVRADDGSLYVGSSDRAILYHITPDPRGARIEAVHDFDGQEIRALARRGPTLYVAVNDFEKSDSDSSSKSALPSRARKGHGAVYRVDPDGRVEQLHAISDGYFTALHVDREGDVYAASGSNGRVYLIHPDRTVVTEFDLPERQVLTMALDGPHPVLGTGDAGAVYRLDKGPPKDAHYFTKVFDGEFHSRWGNARWSGHGLLKIETRSGNTARPDKTWSAWQPPIGLIQVGDSGAGHIASPAGRYLQARVGFGGPHTVLRSLTLYYVPQNQRPRVTDIAIGDGTGKPTDALLTKPRSPVLKLHWSVENPDGDQLIYRLYYREESEVNWKPIGIEAPITSPHFDWNTESIPDGNYLVEVVASDERANPRPDALESALTSAPFLIDNRKPEVVNLRVAYPDASGQARDSFSVISELAYSIDGGQWQPFAPRDGVFDDPTEDFSVKLPGGLSRGAHSLAVRAADAADNVGATQVTFRVK